MLISRTLEKLEAEALNIQKIKTPSGKAPKTRIVQFDFSRQYTSFEFSKIYKERLSDIDISVLVNNVGSAIVGLFTELTD